MKNVNEGDIKSEPQFVPISIQAARESDGLVWWRPNAIAASSTPERDPCLVRVG